MKRTLVPAAIVLAIGVGASSAVSATKPHIKTAHARKIARATQVDRGIQIVAGAQRTVAAPSRPLPDDEADVTKADAFTTDSVDLACPDGLVAIGGGFNAPDDEVVALIGSGPSPGAAGAWRFQVSVQWPDTDAVWTPYVSCAR